MAMLEQGVGGTNTLGSMYNYDVANTFYLLAPPYYQPFYNMYLRPLLQVYDGYVPLWHNFSKNLTPNKLAQSVNDGLFKMMFAHGIDFVGDTTKDTNFAKKWAKKFDFASIVQKACTYSGAGGTALLAINRKGKDLRLSAYRIDQFYADVDAYGNVVSAKIYFDLLNNTNGDKVKHYGVCEERYFNKDGKPCVKNAIYEVGGNEQTATSNRIENAKHGIAWKELPSGLRKIIKEAYPSIMIGEEMFLPFYDHLGLELVKYTDGIPCVPNSQFGRPITDFIKDECYQYDQLKSAEKTEVYVAKGRILMPEEMVNKDDPMGVSQLDETIYEKIGSATMDDSDKPTPVQFQLRANEMRIQKENILRDVAMKLNVSASTIASFLGEGSGAKTATEIMNEKTKTDSWISTQKALVEPPINRILEKVMRYYDLCPVEIIIKSQAQAPTLETSKIYADMLNMGGISAEQYVNIVFPYLSETAKKKEIATITANMKKPAVVEVPQQ